MKKFKLVLFALALNCLVVLIGCASLQETSKNILKSIVEQAHASAQPAATLPASTAEVVIHYDAAGQPVNDLVFGNNIEWVDNGDSVWDNNAKDFSAVRLSALLETKPTSLRFPGGVHADTYHWKYAVGDAGSRKAGQHYYNTEPVASNFGTDEFLKLCKKLNARPIFTLNIISETPQEAAEWVEYVNKVTAKNNYPCALFWEVGNEPYLDNKFGRFTSQQYAKVYGEFARAIRKVDPHAPLGALFVGQDLEKQYREKNGIGWNEALLKDAGGLIDYGSIHNAYYPSFIWNPLSSNEDVFKQTFSSIDKIRDDFKWLEQMIGNRPIKMDITEYNSFFGLNTRFDNYVASLGGSLYVANALQEFISTPIIGGVQYWSMLDNWYFGLVSAGKTKRPNFYVLKLYAQMQGKTVIPVDGLSQKDLKIMAVKDKDQVLVYVINNDLRRPAHLRLNISGFQAAGNVEVKTLFADSIVANNESGQENVAITDSSIPVVDPLEIDVREHSLTVLTIKGR